MRAVADWVVEVNEGVVEATRQGVAWWHAFSLRFQHTDRIRYAKEPCIVGGVCEVACEDQADAEWLAAQMVDEHGLPRTAVRAKRSGGPR